MARLPRIGTVTNLSNGGKHDLLFLNFPDGYPQSALEFKILNTPRKVTGVQKVAQTFLYVLMTEKGVDPIKPNFGTGFVRFMKTSNRPAEYSELHSILEEFLDDAEAQTRALLNPNETDKNSRLKKIDLLGIDSTEDSITAYIKLFTDGGESAPIAVPFPQLDMKLSGETE